ncbi:hypothetical protein Newbould305_2045 [Staphylococcus aureus subsp. aureus str. Newbould 305]|nr:hypothetical protein Newbould305_2045 [Staphylococcus aureus subsp. aureus str. Newbould 305]
MDFIFSGLSKPLNKKVAPFGSTTLLSVLFHLHKSHILKEIKQLLTSSNKLSVIVACTFLSHNTFLGYFHFFNAFNTTFCTTPCDLPLDPPP